ncbi:hypothetical protein BDV95DRAFT_613273 [Massariosphaeria phaeospora]|uniref:DUF7580 domain-containing protein n=1 Tax=Massariosphaeria phaeospora TaxID=100035 RepID=A0A7C8M1G8_9PLEO|nr:hypothetical protein BDV95DRAFT_613273 [Massariosphaeria phaeospora]
MTELLKPVIKDEAERTRLIHNADDPRWNDVGFQNLLRGRLHGEEDRFIRITMGIHDTLHALKKIMGIDNKGAATRMDRPNEGYFRRLRFCASKEKYRGVSALKKFNQELKDILGYSEWLISTTNTPNPYRSVELYERVRQQACKVNEALELHWKCGHGTCSSHQASLRLEAGVTTNILRVLFTLTTPSGSSLNSREVLVRPDSTAPLLLRTPIVQNVPIINDLCIAIWTTNETELGTIANTSNEKFHLTVSPVVTVSAPDTAVLTSLTTILTANQADQLEMTREQRFKMAANIACALLQVQRSPWLSRHWTKDELYFLADTNDSMTISNENTYVSGKYPPTSSDPADWGDLHHVPAATGVTSAMNARQIAETSLFRLGIVILELIYGQTIESSRYYAHYAKKSGLTAEDVEQLAAKQ